MYTEIGEEDTRYTKGRGTRPSAEKQHLCYPLSFVYLLSRKEIHTHLRVCAYSNFPIALCLLDVKNRTVCCYATDEQLMKPAFNQAVPPTNYQIYGPNLFFEYRFLLKLRAKIIW